MSGGDVRELLGRQVTPELYAEVRDLWKKHSIAEDNRDIPGLLSTLTDDCVYEVVGTVETWRGHEGATRFYTQLLTAFPDIKFHLQAIVIGPQGVFEEAKVTATQRGEWLGKPPTGQRADWSVLVFFPWDPHRRKFKGERVYTF